MFRWMKFVAFCCGSLLVYSGPAHASWLPLAPGSKTIPASAMVAGKYSDGSPIYSCQASYQGGLHSGWTMAGKGSCSIGWGGNEVPVVAFSVWQHDWIADSNGGIPYGSALQLGSETAQTTGPVINLPKPRYACVAANINTAGVPEGGTSSGKVASDVGGCLFGWGLSEIHQPNYTVLVDGAFVPYTQGWYTAVPAAFSGNSPVGFYQPVTLAGGEQVPYDALVAAHELDGTPLYLCNTQYIGTQIGKGHWNSCDISYGGAELYLPTYNVFVPYWTTQSNGAFPYQTPVPSNSTAMETAVASGSENGSAFYMCRAAVDNSGALLTGKVNHNTGACSIAYQGREHFIDTYQVLTDRYALLETVIR